MPTIKLVPAVLAGLCTLPLSTAASEILTENPPRSTGGGGPIAASVSGPQSTSQSFGGFTQYQPFAVPAGVAWKVDAIGFWSFSSSDPANFGTVGTLLPTGDDGRFNETDPLAQAFYEPPISSTGLTVPPIDDFTYGDLTADGNVILGEGTYWMRVEPGSVFYLGSLFYAQDGFGLEGLRLRGVDQDLAVRDPVAMRVLGDTVTLGDANLDGRVDLSDFLTLRRNFGSAGVGFEQGDFDFDGQVTLSDFLLLRSNFGSGASDPDRGPLDGWYQSVIPEPGLTGALALLGPLAWRKRRRMRQPA
jgi:hypothetical protein